MSIENDVVNEDDKSQKIQSLREMINNAERTIHSAKAMLLQIEGKKKEGRRKKIEENDENVVHGTFDGQTMVGTDGRQYPVPANYASKSKLVEGDSLKLTIGEDGSFMYKQVGPVPRRNIIGVVTQDEKGNFLVVAENNSYKVLLASITYFHAEPGDEVVIVTSTDENSRWASVESVLRKGNDVVLETNNFSSFSPKVEVMKKEEEKKSGFFDRFRSEKNEEKASSIMDEWTPDISEIEKEIHKEMSV